jgi:3'(2'), 5'-bisphosphate nucleotidase
VSDFSRELEVATRVAREAGALILEVYATNFDVVQKADDQGPVTLADERANELIVSTLLREFPGDSIIAEETTRRDETASTRRWFIDPLDGTREFVARNGMFAVHIGLSVDGQAMVGVVYAPVSGKLYAGTRDGGSIVEVAGVRRPLRVAHKTNVRDLHLLVSRSHRSSRTDAIQQRLGITQVTAQGSVGLKTGLIAEGVADLYLHPSSRSSRWDSCGPEAILRGAGGVLTDFNGTPYLYDGTELANARGLLACSPQVFDAVMPVVRELSYEAAQP